MSKFDTEHRGAVSEFIYQISARLTTRNSLHWKDTLEVDTLLVQSPWTTRLWRDKRRRGGKQKENFCRQKDTMCGLLAVLLADPDARSCQLLYDGLTMLQHRGQDAAGMVTSDSSAGTLHMRKSTGLVKEVFAVSEWLETDNDSSFNRTTTIERGPALSPALLQREKRRSTPPTPVYLLARAV